MAAEAISNASSSVESPWILIRCVNMDANVIIKAGYGQRIRPVLLLHCRFVCGPKRPREVCATESAISEIQSRISFPVVLALLLLLLLGFPPTNRVRAQVKMSSHTN